MIILSAENARSIPQLSFAHQREGGKAVNLVSGGPVPLDQDLVERYRNYINEQYTTGQDKRVFKKILGCLDCDLRKTLEMDMPDQFEAKALRGQLFVATICPVLVEIQRRINEHETTKSEAETIADILAPCFSEGRQVQI